MANATFYSEWLGVDKNQFRILALLAPTGEFIGNLSDMCRSLNIGVQQSNRQRLKTGISELVKHGYITSDLKGRTYSLKANPKESAIEIPCEWLNQVMNHNYSSESVSWQAVLKVFLWIFEKKEQQIVTRSDIAEDLNISVNTVTLALNVL